MFAIGIDFITGVAVMTDAASREKAEWPPHPARVFMALVAAHYESKPLPEDGNEAESAWARERAALGWLESQGAPELTWPEASPRDVVKVYVPVNDAGVPPNPTRVKESEMRSALGVIPGQRSRQERTFPALHIGGDGPERYVHLQWPNAEPTTEILAALTGLARKVTRIGHSSSLALVWVSKAEDGHLPAYKPNAEATGTNRGVRLRIPAPGFLAELDQCFNAGEIDAFFDLSEAIAAGKGKAKEQAKAAFEERFGSVWNRSASAPVRLRPSPGRTAHYSRVDETEARIVASSFDSELLVLAKQEGPVLGLESTAVLTAALRGYLIQGGEGKPEWFTGHSAPGVPSTGGHMALLPLAFVGAEHADGHILGLAVAFPRAITAKERAECLRGRLFAPSGEDLEPELQMGKIGTWTLRREERSLPPLALRSATWCEPSSVWASVTPVVLDRHPKHDQRTERVHWRNEVAASIAQSCERQGLPKPDLIDVDKTSWHRGAPRSRPGPDGMPWLPGKEGTAPRQQVHVLIQFPCEVQGPLLLGAGRFRGYGLFKPLGFLPK
ncbi:MAG: type I-U CRISPR-associated protein Csb2 [Verrucomicrobiales bacterium]|nr:type I-U CRISPR-associated protein Csb2 [Verrucomicrobiales bacterium]